MSAFNQILDKARRSQRSIVLPESSDPRILAAAAEVVEKQLAKPILIGNPDDIKSRIADLKLSDESITIVDPATHPSREKYQANLVEKRQHRGMTAEKADEALADPFVFACMMVAANDANGCVAGAITKTADVVRGAMQLIGKREDVKQVSSFFIMLMNETHPVKDVLVIADCALVIDPDEEGLAAIAVETGNSVSQLLGYEPEIGMLSFSTDGSAKHKNVTKVRLATESVRASRPDWRVVGEVQLDAAVMPSILASKSPDQATDNPCNTLIFPSLDAGNIGYKLIERFGGAQAIGPILQGLEKPVNDLSRGCNQADIVNLVAVTSAQCKGN